MKTLDWALVVIPLVGLLALALYTRRFVRGVADYIAAGRCAGRYLLANASGEAGSGVTNTVSHFEKFLISGFVLIFWEKLTIPIALVLGISGFVIYRYRETRCLTIAQFFEQRYSRNFRLFMGVLAFIAGILNYGIFPAVSARFFIYFLDLPANFALFGAHIPTFLAIMGSYLSVSCMLILFGGQVTLIVTDCVEGILTHAVYIVVTIVLLSIVITAAGSYVLVSLLTCKEPVNMDRLLHRGKYRVEGEEEAKAERPPKPGLLARLIGIDSGYTRTDKWVSGFIFWWSIFCVALNASLVVWHYVVGAMYPALQMTSQHWAHFWLWYGLIIPFLFALGTLIWFSIGGVKDLRHFFHALRTMKRDEHDDGTVLHPAQPAQEPVAAVPVGASASAEPSPDET